MPGRKHLPNVSSRSRGNTSTSRKAQRNPDAMAIERKRSLPGPC